MRQTPPKFCKLFLDLVVCNLTFDLTEHEWTWGLWCKLLPYFEHMDQPELAGDNLAHFFSFAVNKLLAQKSSSIAFESFMVYWAHKLSLVIHTEPEAFEKLYIRFLKHCLSVAKDGTLGEKVLDILL